MLSFVRENEKDKVFTAINFSDKPRVVRFSEALYQGTYTDFFSGESVELKADYELTLAPWAYKVFVK